ncbi:BamA/TamA family outer membrane protein [Mongoliitalea lutea]|uniref:Bacterial surface antigen (D15) domain-containing protein n=1 Tax=Mongoliitalea lutea TaxID=849756 RepID=A0A8J3D2R2_9BACT|nr:BamA/TamA family outer membrane protein [Mongoliitalea lutea]GHB49598.1 hypothetical protein GCM10008106_32920 [Mongoliitalea lutea]
MKLALFIKLFIPLFFSAETDTLSEKSSSLTVIPVVYYTPETLLSLGLGGALTFNLANENHETYESLIVGGAAYTLRNQLLLFSNWRIFTDNNRSMYAGELGYYRYVFFFFGLGSAPVDSNRESFNANLQRLRADYYKKLSSSYPVSLGLKSVLDNYYNIERDALGQLETQSIVGKDGGYIAGFGPSMLLDTRDSQLYPQRGMYLESGITFMRLGNSSYDLIYADFRKIFSINKKNLIVIQLLSEHTFGEVPFFAMPMIGGNKNMRGLFEGQFRDTNMTALNAEFRKEVLPRWKVVLFSGLGDVYGDYSETTFSNIKLTYGTGLRFKLRKSEKLNLRFDVARAHRSDVYFYLTFGEAF